MCFHSSPLIVSSAILVACFHSLVELSCNWWLCTANSGNSTNCCNVNNNGNANNNSASNSNGVPVCMWYFYTVKVGYFVMEPHHSESRNQLKIYLSYFVIRHIIMKAEISLKDKKQCSTSINN